MMKYFFQRTYDTPYGNLLPLIAANAIQCDIFIIKLDSSSSDACDVQVVKFAKMRFSCSDNKPYLLVKKQDHYDACLNLKRTELITNDMPVSYVDQNPHEYGFDDISTKATVNVTTKSDKSRNSNDSQNSNDSNNFLQEMIQFRVLHHKSLISGHININGFRHKFFEVSDMLTQSLLDILFVSESKLDMSFPNIQFHISGFKCHRADRNSRGCIHTQ